MKKSKRKGLSPRLEKNLSVIESMHRGMPRDVYVKMLELESRICEAEAEGKDTSGYVKRMQKLGRSSRRAIDSMRKKHADLRQSYLPTSGLVPSIAEPVTPTAHGAAMTGVMQSTRDLSPVSGPSTPPECEPVCNDFTIKFSRCSAYHPWNAVTTNEVNGGVVGWSKHLSRHPTISNMNGKGNKGGYLDIIWTGTAPGEDVYLMRPNIPVLVEGECFADGYAKPGVDAESDVTLYSFITVGDRILSESAMDLCSVESRLVADTEYFSEYIILASHQMCFYAQKNQEVQIIVRLAGSTWTRGRADAEIIVDMFGIIANVTDDLDIPVTS